MNAKIIERAEKIVKNSDYITIDNYYCYYAKQKCTI